MHLLTQYGAKSLPLVQSTLQETLSVHVWLMPSRGWIAGGQQRTTGMDHHPLANGFSIRRTFVVWARTPYPIMHVLLPQEAVISPSSIPLVMALRLPQIFTTESIVVYPLTRSLSDGHRHRIRPTMLKFVRAFALLRPPITE